LLTFPIPLWHDDVTMPLLPYTGGCNHMTCRYGTLVAVGSLGSFVFFGVVSSFGMLCRTARLLSLTVRQHIGLQVPPRAFASRASTRRHNLFLLLPHCVPPQCRH
jgi:hypothetical protein